MTLESKERDSYKKRTKVLSTIPCFIIIAIFLILNISLLKDINNEEKLTGKVTGYTTRLRIEAGETGSYESPIFEYVHEGTTFTQELDTSLIFFAKPFFREGSYHTIYLMENNEITSLYKFIENNVIILILFGIALYIYKMII